jgi:hypothetical protein
MIKLPDDILQALATIGGPTAIPLDIGREDGQGSDCGVLLVLDAATCKSAQRPGVAVRFQPQLALHPEAAVFRLAATLYDRPANPLEIDAFLNPADAHDLALLRKLSRQRTIEFHFFDALKVAEGGYVFSKRIKLGAATTGDLARLIRRAGQHNAGLRRLDYSTALERFKREQPL